MRLPDIDSFLDAQGGGANLLKDFLAPYFVMPADTTRIDICILSDPYKDISWLLSQLVGHDSMSFIPRYIMYVLHFSIHMKEMFD